MFSWRSFSRWGRECVAFLFAYNGGRYVIFHCLQQIATQITQNAISKIIDAPLMITTKIGQGAGLSIF